MALPKHNFLLRGVYLLALPCMFIFLAWDAELLVSEWVDNWMFYLGF